MRRIGITQRQVAVEGRDEVRDALDRRLAALLWSEGLCPVPLANAIDDVTAYVDALGLDGFVLSGGDDLGATPERDTFERACLAVARENDLPVVGICRGLQMINVACGGTLDAVEGHVAVRHTVTGPLIDGTREVNSFHALGVRADGLSHDLEALAVAPDGTIEALGHRHLPWRAIMWHPERDEPTDSHDRAFLRSVLAR
jgi:putative glutamine amidotransferase